MRPKSEIYTPKRDDEHPHTFHMGNPPPGIIHDRLTNIVKLLFDSDRSDFDPQKGWDIVGMGERPKKINKIIAIISMYTC